MVRCVILVPAGHSSRGNSLTYGSVHVIFGERFKLAC